MPKVLTEQQVRDFEEPKSILARGQYISDPFDESKALRPLDDKPEPR